MRWLLTSFTPWTQEEKIVLRIKADSNWDIYIPTWWYSDEWVANCPYSWEVSIDWWEARNYTWTWSSWWAILVGFGLKANSVHTIKISPVSDEYSRARAFWYNNCQYAPSLINIVYDKSYKWYAFNEISTWNYFRYSQYYWCVNLKSADEENLPWTVKIIWNYFRTSQYRWCTTLKANAEESIPDSVHVLWDYYRSWQYRWCTNIEVLKIKANIFASAKTWYRQDQFEWIGKITKPVSLYIEWWCVETWTTNSLWLINDNVYRVYVHIDTVTDYRDCDLWSNISNSKVVEDKSQSNKDYEYIELEVKADEDWNIWLWTLGMWDDWNITAYDWVVWCNSTTQRYTGQWWEDIVVWTWTPWEVYRVIIKPYSKSFGWGRALWFSWTAWWYIVSYVYDTYKAFAKSVTEAWNHYKEELLKGCTNLKRVYESLPVSCLSVGTNFMKWMAYWCTSLEYVNKEVMHSTITRWDNYRAEQYNWCSSLKEYDWIIALSNYWTGYKSNMFTWTPNTAKFFIYWYEALTSAMTNSLWITWTVEWNSDEINSMKNNSYWSSAKKEVWWYTYEFNETRDINRYSTLAKTITVTIPPRDNYSDYWLWEKWIGEHNWYIYYALNRNNLNTWRVYWIIYRWLENWDSVRLTESVASTTWSSIDGNIRWFAVNKRWQVYYWFRSQSSNGTVYNRMESTNGASISINKHPDWAWAVALSADWYHAYLCWWSNKHFKINPKFSSSLTEVGDISNYTDLAFSDDWKTVYIWDWTKITQYTVSEEWTFNWLTSTWKVLNVSGTWCFSSDWKYLYVRPSSNSSTIYKYWYN